MVFLRALGGSQKRAGGGGGQESLRNWGFRNRRTGRVANGDRLNTAVDGKRSDWPLRKGEGFSWEARWSSSRGRVRENWGRERTNENDGLRKIYSFGVGGRL